MNEQTSNQSSSTPKADGPSGAVPAVHRAAEQVRSATSQRVESAREAAESAKARVAERVRKLSGAVRKIGEHMRIEEQIYIADRANDAGDRLDAVANYISEAEFGTLIRDAEDIARRRPAIVLGGAFVMGLAAARFLKSGSDSNGEHDLGAEP